MATPARACPKCAAEVRSEWFSCPFCAASLPASSSEIPTVAMHPQRKPSSASTDEGRFPAGTTLGERYRVIALLGRGGMGEVYRAHRFEARAAGGAEVSASRRRLEIRACWNVSAAKYASRAKSRIAMFAASMISAKSTDAAFISMEYVDGEDLGSLLRRIGRLPGDKAIEFSRRLCAGLAAAHEKGVLHRDLKPANIMIDGRGQVLIMDFGLAAVADADCGRRHSQRDSCLYGSGAERGPRGHRA